jgi:UDP-glucose 4-epimerase
MNQQQVNVMKPFEGRRVVVTGGTGSLGQVLVHRLLSGEAGTPARVVVFSRDEAKQHHMRVRYQRAPAATDEIIYRNFERVLRFHIGDVRDQAAVATVLRDADVVINAAAMKQVPTCEYFPYEAVRTNVEGAEHIVRAIETGGLPVEVVVGVSTDKACKPVNAMGLSKALQERVFTQGNLRCPQTRFLCVRCGNVLASRGSVIPLFHDQILHGGPLTLTTPDMTRFFLSLDDAVDTIVAAVAGGRPGEIWVPAAPAARVEDVARVLIGDRPIIITALGIRPGEKTHEVLISEEEVARTVRRDRWFAIRPMLPELCRETDEPAALTSEYCSAANVMSREAIRAMLAAQGLLEPAASVTTQESLE